MAGLGLVGAYGLQGARQSLDDLLQQRVLAAKQAQIERQQEVENARAERRLALEERPEPAEFFAASSDQDIYNRRTGGVVRAGTPKPTGPRLMTGVGPAGGPMMVPEMPGAIPFREPKEDAFGKWKQQYDYELTHPKNAPETGISPYTKERQTRTIQSVDELLGKVGRKTVGFGSLLSAIPESDARNFAAEVDTLKSAIIQGELAEMRAASKTGGALGQVSDREANFLASSLGALDIGQSPANMKTQLQKIKASIQRWQAAQALGRPGRTGGSTDGGPPEGGQEFDWLNGRLVPRGQ